MYRYAYIAIALQSIFANNNPFEWFDLTYMASFNYSVKASGSNASAFRDILSLTEIRWETLNFSREGSMTPIASAFSKVSRNIFDVLYSEVQPTIGTASSCLNKLHLNHPLFWSFAHLSHHNANKQVSYLLLPRSYSPIGRFTKCPASRIS